MKDFEVLNKLGQGSFGTVFKVRRKADRNLYVMKMINISQMDRRGQQESINEVKILASLDSPYIVKYYDSFLENKTLHIVMEYCDKGDLSQSIRNQMGRFLPENKIWKFFIQMCLGLEFVHSKKILHRDIKSMNVFLVRDDNIRIGDLGVAKVLANTAAFAHTMVGTPYYLSPELCEEKPYNVKSDVWALGCVLYELCTLKHPFDAINQGALILKIIKGTYLPISSGFSQELKEVVDLCLCKDYRKRPNITGVLNRTGMKDRALALGIAVPQTSVWAGPALVKEPSLVFQSQMSVIEEEKAPLPKSQIKAPSPLRGKQELKGMEKDGKGLKPGENEVRNIKMIEKIKEKGRVSDVKINEKQKNEGFKGPEVKILEKQKISEPLKIVESEKLKIEQDKAKDGKKLGC
jgi:NIMA (never in mitosis gene a)-related kinase